MTPRDPQEEEFIHLVRLCWDLKVLGTPALLVSPTAGSPVLEIPSVAGGRTCVRVVRRSRGPVFTWRPPMEMIADTGLMGSLDVMELNPAFDVHNKTAKLAVDLIESLFGKSTLMRRHAP